MTSPIANWPARALTCAAFLLTGLLLLSQASLKAQPALQITSPADGTSVEPGQTLKITVAASGGTFRMVAVWGTNPLGTSQVLAAPPYSPKNGSRPCALNVEVVIMVQHAQRRRGR
jgi:hypothetical protein